MSGNGTELTEFLDVVDDENQIVGRALRAEVHEKNLLHRAVHLLLRDSHGRFLLQKRSRRKAHYPGCWDSSVSGHVVAGEDFDDTVRKEAGEEIGFTSREPVPVFLLEPTGEIGFEWIQCYVERVTSARFRVDREEVDEVRWWTEEEILDGLTSCPGEFSSAFRIFFFLWREAQFHLPERRHAGWYSVAHGPPDLLHVMRGFLESTGIPVRLENDETLGGLGGHGLFSGKNPFHSDLLVPYDHLVEAMALVYLSRSEESVEETIPEDPQRR